MFVELPIRRVRGEESFATTDCLAVEEPLEIRVRDEEKDAAVAVTMRTPGDDADLAVGYLLHEGILQRASDVLSIRHCGPRDYRNSIAVEIAGRAHLAERRSYVSSSCGVCGKLAVDTTARRVTWEARVHAKTVASIPARLREAQPTFERTGGLHAAALIDESILLLREDVGRHNAVDKVIGAALRAGVRAPILALSGRAGFELVQKACTYGVPIVVAVGAPSSLAVELADESGVTLVGFARADRFNVYSRPERVVA